MASIAKAKSSSRAALPRRRKASLSTVGRKRVKGRVKRVLEARKPKPIEDPKKCLIISNKIHSGHRQSINQCLTELGNFAVDSTRLRKQERRYNPWDEHPTLSSLSERSDAGLMILGNTSASKRTRISFVRFYDANVLDQFDLNMIAFVPRSHFRKVVQPPAGLRPMVIFVGEEWEGTRMKRVQSWWLDYFKGRDEREVTVPLYAKYLVVFVAESTKTRDEPERFSMRFYTLSRGTSATDRKAVKTQECGPRVTWEVSTVQDPSAEMWRRAVKKASKAPVVKKDKHREVNELGDSLGRLNVETQDLRKMVSRQFKGLKKDKNARAKHEGGGGASS